MGYQDNDEMFAINDDYLESLPTEPDDYELRYNEFLLDAIEHELEGTDANPVG